MSTTIRVAIAGGGTGGHFFPALNLGQAMEKEWQAQLLFFGSPRGIESRILPKKGYRLVLLPVQGFQRRLSVQNILFPFRLFKSLQLSKKALKEFKPQLVLGTGGYVMGPVLRTAKKLKIPICIQEQNSYPGVTTRLLARDANLIFLAYQEAQSYLPGGVKAVVTGNPIKMKALYENKQQAKSALGLPPDQPLIALVGGSQGAQSLNQALWQLLTQNDFLNKAQWLWQTGEQHFDYWQNKVQAAALKNVQLRPFVQDMATLYQAADLMICRAGAMTLSELMAMGCPAVLIPFPYAAADHQYKNALAVAQKGAAVVIKDNAQMPAQLARVVNELLEKPDRLKQMAQAMKRLHRPDSIENILKLIAQLLREQGVKLRSAE